MEDQPSPSWTNKLYDFIYLSSVRNDLHIVLELEAQLDKLYGFIDLSSVRNDHDTVLKLEI